MFEKILILPFAFLLSALALAQTPEMPKITPASSECFQKFATLRSDSLKNLKEMLRMQDQLEKKTQIQKNLPSWQVKQMNLERAHSLKSLEILQEIKQNELDEKSCQELIKRLELTQEMTKLSKDLFELMPEEDFKLLP